MGADAWFESTTEGPCLHVEIGETRIGKELLPGKLGITALLGDEESTVLGVLARLLPTPICLLGTSHLALGEQGEREMTFVGALVTVATSTVPHVVGGTVRGGWAMGEQGRGQGSWQIRPGRQAVGTVVRPEQRQRWGKGQAWGGK